MPVPKGYEKKYGQIIGHLQNLGFSRDVSKAKTDKAIGDMAKRDKSGTGKTGRNGAKKSKSMQMQDDMIRAQR